MTRLQFARFALVLYAMYTAIFPSRSAGAEDAYPSKQIQLVVTTAAGGATDLVARTLAQRLSEAMRQAVVVENQPAGSGGIAAGQVARASPDGYTLLLAADNTLTLNPHLYRNLSYDPFRDFTPISVIARLRNILVVHPSLKASDIQGLIALARSAPGKLTYASTGLGTQLHVGMELFKLLTKTEILHIPYRATTAALTDVIAGRVDMALIGQSSAQAQVQGGLLRVLAIASPTRSPLLPDVPTMEEAGVAGYEVSSWFALIGPAQMPAALVERLGSEVKKASTDPKFIEALTRQGMQIVASSPAETLAAMHADSKKWSAVIRETGTTINQ